MARKGEIGLRRGTVKLVAHHPKWAEYFSEEEQLLFKILGEKVLDIRHIGSTSVSGTPAKPILDILAAVETELCKLLLEISLLDSAYQRSTASRDDVLMDAAKRYRVDTKKVQKAVATELAAKRDKRTLKSKVGKTAE